MASNVSVKEDVAGNIRPVKETEANKIDGIVALVMAIGRAIVQQGEAGSVYDDESYEMLVL